LIGDAVAHSPKIRVVTQLLAIAVIAACAVKTDAQVKVWKDTVTLFSHALAIDPRGGPPNLGLGIAYMKQGRIAEAQEYFERALDYNSSRLFALSFSAFCMMQTAMQTHDRRNLPLAGQRLEQALRFAPDDPDTLTNMALWSFLMSRPKDEETYSRKAIAANPDAIQARLYLGDAFQAQGKLDQAAEENRQVLAIEPDNFYAHNDLGMIFYRQGLTGEALKELRRSLAIKPDQVLPHSEIGRILTETHQFPEAVEEFAQVLRLDPENADAHDDLGVALFQLGDDEMAVEQFSDALRIDPANAGARRNLDLARARMKNKKVEYKRK